MNLLIRDLPDDVLAALDAELRNGTPGLLLAGRELPMPAPSTGKSGDRDAASSVMPASTDSGQKTQVAGATSNSKLGKSAEPPKAFAAHDFSVIYPSGDSALELYNRGLQHLRDDDRQAAYEAFLQAYRSGQKLDPERTLPNSKYM